MIRRLMLFILVILSLLVPTSCTPQKTPQEWFDLTWAGLAGMDKMAFQGQASVVIDGRTEAPETFSFEGKLSNHTELSLRSKGTWDGKVASLSRNKADGHILKCKWRDHKWVAVEMQGVRTSWTQSLSRVNPLALLDKIHGMDKDIRLEQGAGRGTRVLRIQTDPELEKSQLAKELDAEMKELKSRWFKDLANLTESKRAVVRQKGEVLWQQYEQQLQLMLSSAEVSSLYHLTMDRKTNLPLRLTSKNVIRYRDVRGIERMELFRSDSRFKQYE